MSKTLMTIALLLPMIAIWSLDPAGGGVARADGDSKLDQGMEKLNRGFRGMRRARGDIQKTLDLIPGMQEGALMSKGEVPHVIEEIKDEKARAEALKRYRIQMIDLMTELLVLEKAALNGEAESVTASVQKLGRLQKAGHDEFREEEEGERRRGRGRGGRGDQ